MRKRKNFKPSIKFGCKNFVLLGHVFGKSTTIGLLTHASSKLPSNSDEERENEDEFMSKSIHVDESEKSEGES